MAHGGDVSLPDVSKLNDLKDDQIEALIAKLAEVQTHAPHIIAALEAQQEARSRGSKSASSRDRPSSSRHSRDSPPNRNSKTGKAAAKPQPPPQIEEEEEDEDYDDFDEDAEYPMVGDGYSDELSVMSDMTTPTVVSSMDINEEEYYRDMVVGGMKISAPKKKDMLSQVARVNARKAPVAAAAPKKKSADMATAKRPSRTGKPTAAATGAATSGTKKKSSKTKTGAAEPGTGATKKVKKKVVKKSANGEGSSSAVAKKKAPQEQKPGPVMIDDDGFLVDQSTFETFDSTNNPFASAPNFTAGPDTGDGFGDFDFAPAPAPAPTTAKKAPPRLKRLDASSGSRPSKKSGSGSVGGAKTKKKSSGRRASVGV